MTDIFLKHAEADDPRSSAFISQYDAHCYCAFCVPPLCFPFNVLILVVNAFVFILKTSGKKTLTRPISLPELIEVATIFRQILKRRANEC